MMLSNNMLAIRQSIEKYWVPHSIKADNDSGFKPLKKKDKEQESRILQDSKVTFLPGRNI